MSDREQIKTILLGLSDVSDSQYNRLIEVYGEDLLIDTIKEIYNEDNSILLKIGKFVSDLYLNIDLDNEMKSAYGYYLDDVDSILDMISEEKNQLLLDVVMIAKRINRLFDKVDGIEEPMNDKIVPWIGDKIEYSRKFCKDINLLDKIKFLYKEYVTKRNELLETYLKFVIMIAKSFYSSDSELELEDLIQYGNMGLIRAIEMYDCDKNVEFLTYAGYWIKQSIIFNSKKVMYPIKFPIHWYEIRNKWARAIEFLIQQLGRYPNLDEIALYIDIEPKKLLMIINSFQMFSSLDELMESNLDEPTDECVCEYDIRRIELMEDNNFSLDGKIEYEEMSSELERYMNLCLDDRSRFILKCRFGFIDGIGISELSKIYGISESRVYEIIRKSCGKLYKNEEFRKMKVYLR